MSPSQNEDFRHLMDPLPADIDRRVKAGDITGALRLIEGCLSAGIQPELAPRLRAEKIRLSRLTDNYPLFKEEAMAQVRQEWPEFTEEQFDALVDNRRIDWRYVNGRVQYHDRFLSCVRIYAQREAPGLKAEQEDHTQRDQMLARMEREGGLTARITLKASIKTRKPSAGKKIQAWLPIPADCPQQSEIEILDATPGYVLGPADSPARTIYWESRDRDSFEVTYRYKHHAAYVDPYTLTCDDLQPTFDTQEELPHIAFTPYLRELCARITKGCKTPVEKAGAIYDYVTGTVDYRYQPAYVLLDSIADSCAKELRGDCGVMALLFITLCRIAGIPARWQSGLSARPDDSGAHDWAMFYIAPYGWLYADPSFGSGARRNGEVSRRKHYFGNLDPCRMVANSVFQAPLTPPNPCYRNDPYDNQLGEMTVDGAGLWGDDVERSVETVEFLWE